MIRIQTIKRILQLNILLIAVFVVSCTSDGIYFADKRKVSSQTWHFDTPLTFSIPASTTDQKGLGGSILLRNNGNYPYRNIYLGVDWCDSIGTPLRCDTLQLMLADQYGRWTGKQGWGSFGSEITLPVSFDFRAGKSYRVVVRHLMRDDFLIGIEDVSLKIVSSHAKL